MADKRIEIVQLLSQKTSDGTLKWELVGDGVLQVQLGNSEIFLTKKNNRETEPDYIVDILNSSGQSVEKFSDVDLYNLTQEPWYPAMQELFGAARRSALGTDKIIDDILNQLRGI